MNDRKWVRSSLRHLSGLLRGRGVALCRGTVGRLLKGLGFSLRANEKRLTGPPHPDRDRQFRYIGRMRRRFLKAGLPVISVDAKKKELVGDFGLDGPREHLTGSLTADLGQDVMAPRQWHDADVGGRLTHGGVLLCLVGTFGGGKGASKNKSVFRTVLLHSLPGLIRGTGRRRDVGTNRSPMPVLRLPSGR